MGSSMQFSHGAPHGIAAGPCPELLSLKAAWAGGWGGSVLLAMSLAEVPWSASR